MLFKRDSLGWWSVAQTYGVKSAVAALVSRRNSERDAEDVARLSRRAICGGAVARRRKNEHGRQFTVLELRFLRRGADGAPRRRTVRASVDRFAAALAARGAAKGGLG